MKTLTTREFNKKYTNDDACLQAIFVARYGGEICPFCHKEANFYKLNGRKCYLCSVCKEHIYPLADTIFHKSDTPLRSWFEAIYKFANSRNGVAATELQRDLGVTYKCAWRMARQIRLLFETNNLFLSGTVEADETYVGGKRRGIRGRGANGKTPVFGIVKRGGEVFAKTVSNVKASTVMPLIRKNVKIGTTVMTDEFGIYNNTRQSGYRHERVNHGAREYVRGEVHTNTIEGFWSQMKRSIDGTHHSVSSKHLQHYVDEFAFRYNHRNASSFLFDLMLERAVQRF